MQIFNVANYRRDYEGETITFTEGDETKSILVQPRSLPYDVGNRTAVVLGNGISRITPEVQLLIKQNANRPIEGYKLTYACNAAFRDTPADYYVLKTNVFLPEIQKENYNKIFFPNNFWLANRDTNLLPYVYHMDAGSTAAYLAAFDGAQRVFLFGFDGNDVNTSRNIYANTYGYDDDTPRVNYEKFNTYLYNVIRVYSSTEFYRVRTAYSSDFADYLRTLPNYHEINVRDAVMLGDF